MKNITKLTMLMLGAFCLQSHANTPSLMNVEEPSQEASDASKSAVKQAKDQLEKGQVNVILRRGLENLIDASINVLNEFGHNAYAKQMEQEWLASFSLKTHNVLDLGDHAPLSQWLSDFYAGLEARVAHKWLKLFNLTDIKIFNYGIPVSVHPRSNPANGQEWGHKEYKLHFVPTSSAAVYWISSQACSIAVPLPWSLGCGVAARLPRFGMEHFVAPGMSDRVYDLFN